MIVSVDLPLPILRVVLGPPPKALRNSASKATLWPITKAIKEYRTEAGWAFKQAAKPGLAALSEASVLPVFWGHQNRGDKDNATHSLKPVFDGMQDAGVIENDVGLVHLPPVIHLAPWKESGMKRAVEILVFREVVHFTIDGLYP